MKQLLAQINIGILKAPIDHPDSAEFVNNLDQINTLAESSPGFIWRLKDDNNNATSFNPYHDEKIIVNMSVWESLDHLKSFVYQTEHIEFIKRRKEWFMTMDKPHMALWWTIPDQMPDADEGKKRLDHLWEHGPTDFAFDYRTIKSFT